MVKTKVIGGICLVLMGNHIIQTRNNLDKLEGQGSCTGDIEQPWYATLLQKGEDATENVVDVDVPSSAQCSSEVEDDGEVVVKVDVTSSAQCSSEVEANIELVVEADVLSSVKWLSTEKESIDSNPVTELYVVQDGVADQVESNNLIDYVNDLIDAETEDNSFETIAIVTESNINTKVLKIKNPSALMYLINYKQ